MTADIFLHVNSKKGADRGILVGETGTGKSTLAAALIIHFLREHWPNCRILLADTKPRWRATRTLMGPTITQRYQNMVSGDEIDAVLLDESHQWKLAWDKGLNPSRVVIMQPDINKHYDQGSEIARQVWAMREFFRTQNPRTPSLLYIDEGMDFFGPNGMAKEGDIIQRCFRAGREKGLCTLMAVQRPRAISLQALTESNILYLFAIAYQDDVKRLYEMGLPKGVMAPEEDYYFRLLRDRKLYPKLLTLKM